jgi:hypothetical protein
MSLNYENVGKNVIYNRSVDNIEDYVKGTIVGCYIGEDEEYYITSIESSGECKKVYDDSLIEVIEGGGGGSGAVSSVNGHTGTVVLDAEDVGAEPKKFVITVTYDDGNDEYTADKTFSEIVAAYEAGKTLVVIDGDTYDTYHLFYIEDGGSNIDFINLNTNLWHEAYIFTIKIFDDDSIEYYSDTFKAAPATVTDLASTSITLTAQANTEYHYGELTSLTISNPPATGAYSIVFTSGATATTTTIPATILGLEDFAAEANTLYEINVLDNRAVVGSWAVSV